MILIIMTMVINQMILKMKFVLMLALVIASIMCGHCLTAAKKVKQDRRWNAELHSATLDP